MRDICGDLQERANIIEREIKAEHARFEMLLVQLKGQQDNRLAELRTQLWAVRRFVEVATWQHKLRTAVSLLATAEAAIEGVKKQAYSTPDLNDPPVLH